MKNSDIEQLMSLLALEVKKWKTPAVTVISREGDKPFRVLISCIISLRTKDDVTAAASERLFALAPTPQKMAPLSLEKIEGAIYPAGFYKVKAAHIKSACQTLINDYDSKVPDDIETLLKLKGVGRKTANLVVTLGYNKPGICVDTHVHRITNRWGYVKTKKPDDTEFALRKKLPKKYWIDINDQLVTFGQNQCVPISPFCSTCGLAAYCKRLAVNKSR